MKFSTKPQLFIITGSNGAGKSTYKQALLPAEFSNLEILTEIFSIPKKAQSFINSTDHLKSQENLRKKHLRKNFYDLLN